MGSIPLSGSAILFAISAYSADTMFRVHGQAWTEAGRIMKASDTLINGTLPTNKLNLNGNGLQSLGAQFTILASLGENWEAAFGFGTYRATHALGKGEKAILAIPLFQNFITQSRLTYQLAPSESQTFSFTLGSFPYKYHPDVKNLGLYLLRGPVYPGILMGGFQDFHVDTSKSTMLGARIHHGWGNLSQDIILNSEREISPTLDWSLAYVAKYKAFGALDVGAGFNFYRLIPHNPDLMVPGRLPEVANDPNLFGNYIEVDSSGPTPDTVFFTHQGTKAMAFFSLDLKPMFGINSLGRNDMKLYGEAAILGLKDYGTTYGDIFRRIPIMFGINLPAFRLLDHLAFEVEWYGARYRNDLARLGINNVVADWTFKPNPIPSPKPVSYADYGFNNQGVWVDPSDTTRIINLKGTASDKENLSLDDIKWSLFLEKSIHKHIRLTGQIANDHYRPRPVATGLIFANGGTAEAFSSPQDWYFMFRLGFYF